MAKRKMNAALSLVLSLAVVTSALPVTAQAQTEAPQSFDLRSPVPTASPLARAAILEAVRLAEVTGKPKSSATGNVEQPRQSRSSDWSRVRELAPGAEIILTVKSAWTSPRYFVAADSLELVVSNAAGQVEHIARAAVIEIKRERSKVLLYTLAGPLSIALALAGGAIGHTIQGGEGLGGPLLGALAVGVGGAVVVHKVYPKWDVIYRTP